MNTRDFTCLRRDGQLPVSTTLLVFIPAHACPPKTKQVQLSAGGSEQLHQFSILNQHPLPQGEGWGEGVLHKSWRIHWVNSDKLFVNRINFSFVFQFGNSDFVNSNVEILKPQQKIFQTVQKTNKNFYNDKPK